MNFEFNKNKIPKYWHSGSPSISFFFNALSSAFPPGEKFFCDAVAFYKDQVKDDSIRHEIDQFVKQESHHIFQHKLFNKAISSDHAIDMKSCEKRNADFLRSATSRFSPLEQLALTLAFEHFTASLADHVLRSEDFYENVHQSAAPLWLWHAAEETEHKSVAYKVFEQVGGTYWIRVKVYLLAFYKLFSIAFINQWNMLRSDKSLSMKDLWICFKYLFGANGILRAVLASLLIFFRKDFHPDHHGNDDLVTKWENENGKSIVSKAS